jgi:hypothetical protein
LSKSALFAIAVVLLWVAGVCFFVAFHPGGLSVNGNPAQNPADVLKYLMGVASTGNKSGTAGEAPDDSGTSTTQTA